MKSVILNVGGMTCSGCSAGLEKYLSKQNGIVSASVNLVLATVKIEYDETILDINKLNKFIKEAGFTSYGEEYNKNKRKPERYYRVWNKGKGRTYSSTTGSIPPRCRLSRGPEKYIILS